MERNLVVHTIGIYFVGGVADVTVTSWDGISPFASLPILMVFVSTTNIHMKIVIPCEFVNILDLKKNWDMIQSGQDKNRRNNECISNKNIS